MVWIFTTIEWIDEMLWNIGIKCIPNCAINRHTRGFLKTYQVLQFSLQNAVEHQENQRLSPQGPQGLLHSRLHAAPHPHERPVHFFTKQKYFSNLENLVCISFWLLFQMLVFLKWKREIPSTTYIEIELKSVSFAIIVLSMKSKTQNCFNESVIFLRDWRHSFVSETTLYS